MPRTELLDLSAPRAELDQRSRDARLRLEQVERLLVVRPWPRQSLLRRVVRCLRFRIYVGQIESRSTDGNLSGTYPERGRQTPSEKSSAAGNTPAARPGAWPHCMRGPRSDIVRSGPVGIKPW
jgi:hypothetical protein